jgi:hypothetical protein
VRNGKAPEEYRNTLTRRLNDIRRGLGYAERPFIDIRRPVASAQMSLAWNAKESSEGWSTQFAAAC